MIFIDFQNAPALLVLTEPDWAGGDVTVRLSTPTDVATSLHARESRRVFARSLRYTISYPVATLSAQETTAFRQALNRLKVEPVLCPLWTDAVELASDVGPGATALPFSPVPGPAARYGSTWCVLNEATAQWELVQVTGQGASSLTLASPGLVFAWAAGTRVYPVLFGRFATRPELRARSTASWSSLRELFRSPWENGAGACVTPATVSGAS